VRVLVLGGAGKVARSAVKDLMEIATEEVSKVAAADMQLNIGGVSLDCLP